MEKTEPWKINVSSLLIVYSILAAIASVGLFFVLGDKDHFSGNLWMIPVFTLALSAFFFIYSAEQITDCLDEDDVDKLIYLYFWYNLAVILLFAGITSIICTRYFLHTPFVLCQQYWPCIISSFIFIIFSWRWIKNLCWLVSCTDDDYKSYIELLKGIRKHEKNHDWRYKFFMWVRKIF